MCSKAVLSYLETTNRPYSANDIVQNLHNAHSKNAIQNALDELTNNGVIREKVYGKQKVYCILQKEQSNDDGELDELNADLNKFTQELNILNTKLKQAEAKLKELSTAPTLEEAKIDNERLQKLNAGLSEKLTLLKSGTTLISEAERKEVKKIHEKMTSECRKRKRWFMELFDAVLENYPKNKAALIEESGVDL